jgi:hypothetical protein
MTGTSNMPVWAQANLQDHYAKHPGGKDQACWMDVLSKTSIVSINEYENASYTVISTRWFEYECEDRDRAANDYYPSRVHYVDDRELRVIASLDRANMITCYHVHWDRPHDSTRQSLPVGERRLDYKKRLQWSVDGGMMRGRRIIFDGTS